MNVQAAVKDGDFFIIEINPRASRTVPYLSKASGIPLAKVATKVSVGMTLKELGLTGPRRDLPWRAVKEAVLPFDRFPGVDPVLGPEMKSTGEVMGMDTTFEVAYWKSQIAAGQRLPLEGRIFVSARDADKPWMVEIGAEFVKLGFRLVATEGTAKALKAAGIQSDVVAKLSDNAGGSILDRMHRGELAMVIHTPSGTMARVDEVRIRGEAIVRDIAIVTTESGARATLASIRHMRSNPWDVTALQDYLARLKS